MIAHFFGLYDIDGFRYNAFMKMNCSNIWCDFFKAVHDRHRQHILDLIHKHGPLNANQIVKRVSLSQPTVSHHLKILNQAKIVNSKKQGKEVIYSINEKSIKECCGSFMARFASDGK